MSVHLIFVELAVNSDQNDTRPGPVGQEIIRMYKERIFRLRLQAIHESVFDNKCRVLNEKDNEIQLLKKDLVIKSETIILHKDNQRSID